MKGNEAIAEAAIQAGCDAYFGYPITPQAELLEWMARRMPELGRVFVQAESELGAINMGLGAAATGARVMVSSSSPGISLMAEAMSYMAGSELPLVLVNVMRGGPGLGSIGPSQSDYFQATKGHGHGDYRVPVLAPSSISEAVDLVATAFEIAERYRTPTMLLADGVMGQAMEPVVPTYRIPDRSPDGWQLDRGGRTGRHASSDRSTSSRRRSRSTIDTCRPSTATIEAREVRWAGERLDDAEIAIVAYGTAARVARTAIERARDRRPRASACSGRSRLWPFPSEALAAIAARCPGDPRRRAIRRADGRGRPAGGRGRDAGPLLRPHRRHRPDPGRGRGRVAPCVGHHGTTSRRGRLTTMTTTELQIPGSTATDRRRRIYRRPELLADRSTHYCPGCGHGIIHRIVAELLDELALGAADDRRRVGRLQRVRLRLPRRRLRRIAARPGTGRRDRRAPGQARRVRVHLPGRRGPGRDRHGRDHPRRRPRRADQRHLRQQRHLRDDRRPDGADDAPRAAHDVEPDRP